MPHRPHIKVFAFPSKHGIGDVVPSRKAGQKQQASNHVLSLQLLLSQCGIAVHTVEGWLFGNLALKSASFHGLLEISAVVLWLALEVQHTSSASSFGVLHAA